MLLSDICLSDVCLSVAYIVPNWRTERPRKTKIGTEVAHVTWTLLSRSKGQGHQATLVGCTGRPTWTYSSGHLSICIHDIYHVTTWRPGRGHIMAATHLQLVKFKFVCII